MSETKLRTRSNCPVSSTLDVVGDKWTLLIIRDLVRGKSKYGEFLASAEKIPTNILANRLRSMEKNGLIEKKLYSQHSRRHEYSLTDRGWKFAEVVKYLKEWGERNLDLEKENGE